MKYELLRCGVDINRDPIQEILVTRGIPCMEIPNYLYTTDTDITPPLMKITVPMYPCGSLPMVNGNVLPLKW